MSCIPCGQLPPEPPGLSATEYAVTLTAAIVMYAGSACSLAYTIVLIVRAWRNRDG